MQDQANTLFNIYRQLILPGQVPEKCEDSDDDLFPKPKSKTDDYSQGFQESTSSIQKNPTGEIAENKSSTSSKFQNAPEEIHQELSESNKNVIATIPNEWNDSFKELSIRELQDTEMNTEKDSQHTSYKPESIFCYKDDTCSCLYKETDRSIGTSIEIKNQNLTSNEKSNLTTNAAEDVCTCDSNNEYETRKTASQKENIKNSTNETACSCELVKPIILELKIGSSNKNKFPCRSNDESCSCDMESSTNSLSTISGSDISGSGISTGTNSMFSEKSSQITEEGIFTTSTYKCPPYVPSDQKSEINSLNTMESISSTNYAAKVVQTPQQLSQSSVQTDSGQNASSILSKATDKLKTQNTEKTNRYKPKGICFCETNTENYGGTCACMQGIYGKTKFQDEKSEQIDKKSKIHSIDGEMPFSTSIPTSTTQELSNLVTSIANHVPEFQQQRSLLNEIINQSHENKKPDSFSQMENRTSQRSSISTSTTRELSGLVKSIANNVPELQMQKSLLTNKTQDNSTTLDNITYEKESGECICSKNLSVDQKTECSCFSEIVRENSCPKDSSAVKSVYIDKMKEIKSVHIETSTTSLDILKPALFNEPIKWEKIDEINTSETSTETCSCSDMNENLENEILDKYLNKSTDINLPYCIVAEKSTSVSSIIFGDLLKSRTSSLCLNEACHQNRIDSELISSEQSGNNLESIEQKEEIFESITGVEAICQTSFEIIISSEITNITKYKKIVSEQRNKIIEENADSSSDGRDCSCNLDNNSHSKSKTKKNIMKRQNLSNKSRSKAKCSDKTSSSTCNGQQETNNCAENNITNSQQVNNNTENIRKPKKQKEKKCKYVFPQTLESYIKNSLKPCNCNTELKTKNIELSSIKEDSDICELSNNLMLANNAEVTADCITDIVEEQQRSKLSQKSKTLSKKRIRTKCEKKLSNKCDQFSKKEECDLEENDPIQNSNANNEDSIDSQEQQVAKTNKKKFCKNSKKDNNDLEKTNLSEYKPINEATNEDEQTKDDDDDIKKNLIIGRNKKQKLKKKIISSRLTNQDETNDEDHLAGCNNKNDCACCPKRRARKSEKRIQEFYQQNEIQSDETSDKQKDCINQSLISRSINIRSENSKTIRKIKQNINHSTSDEENSSDTTDTDNEETTESSENSPRKYRCSCPHTTSKNSGSKIIYDYTFK